MPENVVCEECETTLLGLDLADSKVKPMGREDCPVCGGTSFAVESERG